MSKQKRLDKLKLLMQDINKSQKETVLSFASDEKEWEKAPSGVYELDTAIGGGFPYGHCSVVWGGAGCLTGDTIIEFCSFTKNNNIKEKKNKTLKRLYHMFHNIPESGSGKYIRKESTECKYLALSVDENNKVFYNEVKNVVFSGIKNVYKIKTEHNDLCCTKDHKFLTPSGYKPLSELKKGDVVYFYPKNYFGDNKKKRIRRKQICVKYHPTSTTTYINGCKYYKITDSHLAFEANKNNMSVSEYREYLNKESKDNINKLWTVDKTLYEIHHIDKNPLNNNLKNLQLLFKKEHAEIHNNLYKTKREVALTTIKDVVYVGKQETFDIEMMSPHNNFIANRIVVHNSSKSSLMYSTVAQAQRDGKVVAFLDLENSFNAERASIFGVDCSELIIGRYSIAEDALDTIIKLAKEKAVDLCVLDSIHSLSPAQENADKKGDRSVADNSQALLARKLGQFFRMASTHIYKANMALVMIGQTRTNLGGYIALQTLSGGMALLHNSLLTIHLRRGQNSNAPVIQWKEAFLDPDGKFHLQTRKEPAGFEVVAKIDKKQVSGGQNEKYEISLPYYFDTGFIAPNENEEVIKIDTTMNEEQVKVIKEHLVKKGYNQFNDNPKELTLVPEIEVEKPLEDIPVKKRGRKKKNDF